MALGPPKQRAVLSLLASRAGEVVGPETITSALWGSDTPHTAANGVHTYVAGLRRVLEPGRGRRGASTLLTSEPGGYCLRMDPAEVDATLFVQRHTLARRSREGGHVDTTLGLYEGALASWHGEAYSGVPGPFAAMESLRLRDLRLTAVEEWAAVMLEAGRHTEAVSELTRAVADEPLREKLRGLLMQALCRSGRQVQALSVYMETRQLLRRELGIEPGAELRDVHQQILAGGESAPVPDGHPTGGPADRAGTITGVRETLTVDIPKPAQLPPLARGFTGRVRELEQLDGMLGDECPERGQAASVVIVHGPAGVGKSALVVKLAHRLSDRFPEGQLYVDLGGNGLRGRPLSASDALLQVLTSLGVDSARIPRDPAARTTLYRSLLHDKRMLVVLDDALSADQIRPLIPHGPSCVVATSRQRFRGLAARDGARTVPVGPLVDGEAAQLLTTLCEGRFGGQEATALRLAALCGGLPLAVRILAEKLTANSGVPLDALLEQYGAESGRLDRLTVADDALASIRNVFETSYQALPAEAARMFRHLGLYRDGLITVRIAAALADTDAHTARRLLDTLVANHLLEEEGGFWYRFADLIGIYAAECARREPPLNREAALTRLDDLRSAIPWPRSAADECVSRVGPDEPALEEHGNAVRRLGVSGGRQDAPNWPDSAPSSRCRGCGSTAVVI
ncbi:BTAD domain-containing putative transcriptional regulator [Streptomyces sp. ADMS]|uniref:AfsR/SARP family transcriptional regulator n=1 Tax=Streptomyces sp. ADMS TaxID=3071415 RepID=UPI00296EF0F5|nr:BTAD domain-containing putative transcriptional regulator [Streptomyces sp. ADMS]MDW4905785.1 BTAD domain-containing putative transcriptional regulator [Streptomyces sp. ADMS]